MLMLGIFLRKIQFIRGMQTEGTFCQQKKKKTNALDGNNIFLIIFLWDFLRSGNVHTKDIYLAKNHFRTDFHQNILEFYWYSTAFHRIWSPLAPYKIKYCETCQLQFYLKPDGLLCFITLAYQNNHLLPLPLKINHTLRKKNVIYHDYMSAQWD